VSALLDVADLIDLLGEESSADEALLDQLIGDVEAVFLGECNRADLAFSEAAPGREEELDGTGTATLWLDYPIADLTSVVLGYNVDQPDCTLDPDDVTQLVWKVGSRRVSRVDGGVFGCLGLPLYVHVTYDTQEYLPADAAAAIKSVCAAWYRQRGSDGLRSERVGPYSSDFRSLLDSDDLWQSAVSHHREIPV